jgi:chromosome segregation ATPase
VSGVFGGGREARRQAYDAAFAAKSAAAEMFLQLDTVQGRVESRVTSLAELDGTAKGARLLDQFRPHVEAANRATAAYLEVVEAQPIDGEHLRVPQLQQAAAAFSSAMQRLRASRDSLIAFEQWAEPQLQQMAGALGALTSARRRAEQSLAEAEEALTTLRAAGTPAPSLEQRASAVVQRLAAFDATAAGRTIREASAAMADVDAAAAELVKDAAGFGVEIERSRVRLRSMATRVAAVREQLARVPEDLSALRRAYSEACSRDLNDVPEVASAQLEHGRRALRDAERAAVVHEWERVAELLRTATDELDAAEAGIHAVRRRVEELKDVAADPAQRWSAVQFKVRDAQRFVLSAKGIADPVASSILDALMVRLDRARGELVGPHPDYWSYLQELRSISAMCDDVIGRVRAAIAAHR